MPELVQNKGQKRELDFLMKMQGTKTRADQKVCRNGQPHLEKLPNLLENRKILKLENRRDLNQESDDNKHNDPGQRHGHYLAYRRLITNGPE